MFPFFGVKDELQRVFASEIIDCKKPGFLDT